MDSEHRTNCLTCWKKSDRKLWTTYQENPSAFGDFYYLEQMYGHIKAPDKDRLFWRKHRSTTELIDQGLNTDFIPFVEIMPELQLRLITDDAFEIDEIDKEEDCGGGSCEAL